MNFSKSQALWFSAVLLALVLYPVKENWAKTHKDSFPLSYYPMFATKRSNNYGLYYVVGKDTTGNAIKIPYKLIGEGGFNQVRRQITRARKRENGIPFLKKVAVKIAMKEPRLYAKLNTLQLVKGYYSLEGYFIENDTLPVLERIIAALKLEQNEQVVRLP